MRETSSFLQLVHKMHGRQWSGGGSSNECKPLLTGRVNDVEEWTDWGLPDSCKCGLISRMSHFWDHFCEKSNKIERLRVLEPSLFKYFNVVQKGVDWRRFMENAITVRKLSLEMGSSVTDALIKEGEWKSQELSFLWRTGGCHCSERWDVYLQGDEAEMNPEKLVPILSDMMLTGCMIKIYNKDIAKRHFKLWSLETFWWYTVASLRIHGEIWGSGYTALLFGMWIDL